MDPYPFGFLTLVMLNKMVIFSGGKMLKRIGLIILLVLGVVFLSSCTRNDVKDPDMKGGAGFRIQISGTANPSVLHIPENLPSVFSNISARVLASNGSPAVNYTVVFQTGTYGYFDNFRLSDKRTTDGNGVARIKFYIPPGTVTGDTRIKLKATVVDDGRNDIPFLSESYDNIPIRLIPYDGKEMVAISGHVSGCAGVLGIPGVQITFSNTGTLAVSRSSGSYSAYVPWGWSGEIKASLLGFTFIPAAIKVGNPVYIDLTHQDFFGTATNSGLVVSPEKFDVIAAGASNLAVWVGSVDNICPISYRVSAGADWITIVSGATGTTEGTFRFNVSSYTGTTKRSGEISIISTTSGVISTVVVKVEQGA